MKDNFNKEAMEEKIKLNEAKGFTPRKIQIALKEEQLTNLKQMAYLEERNIELQDQIDYMEEKYDFTNNSN